MRLAGYLRVSTELQAEEGLGLEVQRATITAWAAREGHEMALWFTDAGLSGSNGVETREGLFGALNALKDGEASGLVVAKLDRLSRKLTVQESTLAMVWAEGASMFSADLGAILADDPDDPMRTALRQMIGVFAQLERGMIVARLNAGRRAKRDAGGYAGHGAPPFGWRSVEGELVEVASRQETIRRARELSASGLTLRAVGVALEAEGRAGPRGPRWHLGTLSRVLKQS